MQKGLQFCGVSEAFLLRPVMAITKKEEKEEKERKRKRRLRKKEEREKEKKKKFIFLIFYYTSLHSDIWLQKVQQFWRLWSNFNCNLEPLLYPCDK